MIRFYLSIIIVFITTGAWAQGENALMSLSFGQKNELAFNKDDKLYQGRFRAARREILSNFKDLYENEYGPIQIGAPKGATNDRPTILKRIDEIVIADLKDAGKRYYAEYLNRAGIFYHIRGQLSLADYLLIKSLKLRGELYGKTSQLYIATMHNLSVLRKDQGRFRAAEDMLGYILRYYSQVNGKQSREYIIALANKAMLDGNLGRIKLASQALDEALDLHSQNHDNLESIDQERMLTNRGLLALESGETALAKSYLQKAKLGFEKKGFENHPNYNELTIYLGQVYLSDNSTALITPLIEKAIEQIRKDFSESHPFYANILELRGEFYMSQKDYSNAKDAFEEATKIRLNSFGDRHVDYLEGLSKLALVNGFLGNDQIAIQQFSQVIEAYLSLTSSVFKNMSESEQASFWRKFNKNINLLYEYASSTTPKEALNKLLLEVRMNTKGLLLNNSTKVKELISNSDDTETKTLFYQWQSLKEELSGYYSLNKEQLAEEGIDLSILEQRANTLEKQLVLKSELFSENMLTKNIDLSAFQNKLQDDQVAVEMIRFSPKYSDNERAGYLALSVSKSDIKLVKIGSGDLLEGRYFKYYQNAIKNKITDTLSYFHYWKPLAETLTNGDKVYFSPDGVYNSLSISSLADSEGYLADKLDVFIVSNIDRIIETEDESISPSQALLVGNPTFGSDKINPLPGTAVEIKKIDSLLQSKGYSSRSITEEKADEELIKSIDNPSILHVATHGFFIDPNKNTGRSTGLNISRATDHPLLKSGLLMAGAGYEQDTDESILPIERANNGILTAFEAAGLNLTNTSLVVLSACETGLGDVLDGEGVYGLSRSFKIAGAEAVIISLWKVDDEATQELMVEFYRRLLESGNLYQSFTQAQLMLKEKYPEPYYWAPFVLLL